MNKISSLIKINSIINNTFHDIKKFKTVNQIKIKNLSFKFKDKILINNINLNIKKYNSGYYRRKCSGKVHLQEFYAGRKILKEL